MERNAANSRKSFLIWSIILCVVFWPVGVPMLISYFRSKNRSSSFVSRNGTQRSYWTDEQLALIKQGYKSNIDNDIFTPNTVWTNPRSKVYHCEDSCGGYFLNDAVPVPESEALRRGKTRCKKCDWGNIPIPQPGTRPVAESKPVSKFKW